jgi:hypothetical protein
MTEQEEQTNYNKTASAEAPELNRKSRSTIAQPQGQKHYNSEPVLRIRIEKKNADADPGKNLNADADSCPY